MSLLVHHWKGEGRALLHGLHLVAGTGFEPVTFRL